VVVKPQPRPVRGGRRYSATTTGAAAHQRILGAGRSAVQPYHGVDVRGGRTVYAGGEFSCVPQGPLLGRGRDGPAISRRRTSRRTPTTRNAPGRRRHPLRHVAIGTPAYARVDLPGPRVIEVE
jgi:hypothetical protein